MDTSKLLRELTDAAGIGTVKEATAVAARYLSEFCKVTYTEGLGLIARIDGKKDYTLMLEAHIDEIGFIVTGIDKNGFLTVSNCGGIDLRALPSRQVIIHGKEKVRGVFCATPPHLAEKDVSYDDIADLKIDSCSGKKAKEIISEGDYVTFVPDFKNLESDKLSSKSFDDRAGVAVLIELASRLSAEKPPVNVVFCLSDMEELSLRGAKTSAFKVTPDEAIAIDVSFGDGPDISAEECGRLCGGAMIGVSPVISRDISDKLIRTAKDNCISYQTEIMGASTGTDADVISVTKSGVKTGLVSIPIRNMHTDCEVVSLADIKSVCDLLFNYVKGGGMNG